MSTPMKILSFLNAEFSNDAKISEIKLYGFHRVAGKINDQMLIGYTSAIAVFFDVSVMLIRARMYDCYRYSDKTFEHLDDATPYLTELTILDSQDIPNLDGDLPWLIWRECISDLTPTHFDINLCISNNFAPRDGPRFSMRLSGHTESYEMNISPNGVFAVAKGKDC